MPDLGVFLPLVQPARAAIIRSPLACSTLALLDIVLSGGLLPCLLRADVAYSHPDRSGTRLCWYCACSLLSGCGTTRSTDTNRTATEQLLISDAIDRAVQSIQLQTLAGQTVYLDDSRLGEVVDRNYLVSTLRQHLLASGCQLRAERDQADFIVEARAGAIGTDRNDLLFGVPSMNVPQIMPVQPRGRGDSRGPARQAA